MWVFYVRSAPPDAPYWAGRRWLAAVDAIAWPALGCYGLSQIDRSGGLVVWMATAMLLLAAGRRLWTALLANHRYRFTMWRWGRVLLWFVVVGALLKLSTQA